MCSSAGLKAGKGWTPLTSSQREPRREQVERCPQRTQCSCRSSNRQLCWSNHSHWMRWVLTRTLQHLMIPHCMTILSHAPLGATPGNYRQAHMFSMPEADDIPPSSRNQGLNPSEDFAEMILQCCEGGSASRFGPGRSHPRVPAEDTRPLCRRT